MENKSYNTCFYLTKNRLSVSLTETKQQNKHNPIIFFFFLIANRLKQLLFGEQACFKYLLICIWDKFIMAVC